jgi:HEAT repeat protein
LGDIKSARSTEALIGALNDPSTQRAASVALEKLGAPAIAPLITVLDNATWPVQREAARLLGEIRVTPSGLVAGSVKPSVDARAETRLLLGLRDNDTAVIVGAIRFFIRRGDASSRDLLIQTLNAKGDSEMVNAFLNSGNADLEASAKRWASEHGYIVLKSFSGSTAHWGQR